MRDVNRDRLRDLAGHLRDAVRQLRELGAAAPLEGGNGFTFGVLYGQAAVASPAALRQVAKRLRTAVEALS